MKFLGKKQITGIGILYPEHEENVGTLWRSAMIFGVDFIFTIGRKYFKQASDVFESYKSVPCFFYPNFDDFYAHLPYNCRLVGVEMYEKAICIETFQHFSQSVYLLGSEHSGIAKKVLERCHAVIQLPKGSYNVAMAGTIVLYDRYLKNQWKGADYES
ncbi:MAG: RNA methyltransferase [Bacteroidia bacterium]|nr:RNA methyltransferase [Bacteroidia bacterium]MDW8346699.1 RNA methyltransferase [Bacteroidia bacterium]